jgi:hypothetical protein
MASRDSRLKDDQTRDRYAGYPSHVTGVLQPAGCSGRVTGVDDPARARRLMVGRVYLRHCALEGALGASRA